jgi:Zn-finger nucleic acid-binding protein
MRCPACGHELNEIKLGSVAIDVCEAGCGGIWFDANELKKIEQEQVHAPDQVVDIHRDPDTKPDVKCARYCPRCLTDKLETRIPRLGSAIEFDCCPRCGGYWLDHGELETLLKENKYFAPGKTGKRIYVNLEVVRFIHTVKIRKIAPRQNRKGGKTVCQNPRRR